MTSSELTCPISERKLVCVLSVADNETLTQVGRGTPMGSLMREYWLPALLSSELPQSDSNPVRLVLLGEQLIAFRDTNAKVGLLANNCPHRGASLFFGRNEEAGLRCVYHGWKFDVDGRCVDMPNEPAESDFKHKVTAVAYPTRERNGVVWAYMGSRSEPPPLPDLEANMLPDGGQVTAWQRSCNWMQALEGDIDTVHLGFLHVGSVKPEDQVPGTFSYLVVKERAPRYSIVDIDGGVMYGTYRDADQGREYWRVGQFLFPFYTLPPQGILGRRAGVQAWVPMDDEHTMLYTFSPRPAPGPRPARAELLPNDTSSLGRFRLVANSDNDYEIDRAQQRRNDEYTGLRGFLVQDQAITESMGTIFDRSREHLGTSDSMIIRTRRRLLAAAQALASEQVTPPGVDRPEVYGVRSGGIFLPKGTDWVEATGNLVKAFTPYAEVDTSISGPITG